MTRCRSLRALVLLALALLAGPARAVDPKPVVGTWYAALVPTPGRPVGCVLTITAKGADLAGSIRNGSVTEKLSRVAWDGTTLRLFFDHYDSRVEATLDGNALSGTYWLTRPTETIDMPFAASRTAPAALKAPKGRGLSGEWAVDVGDAKLEGVFTQKGAAVTGTLLSETGDYGPLHGTFDGTTLVLQVFNGFFCYRFDAALRTDGKLSGEFRSRKGDPVVFTAARTAAADPVVPITLKDPEARLRFSLPDASGTTVSSEDVRFRGKALIVTIMGTWCPNCHDEAPVLADLARRYGPKGLEVVGIAYEYTDDAHRSRRQMARFAERYGVGYPTLLAGTTKDAPSSLVIAQLQGWKGFPTTLFFDRSGKLASAHSGFDGPATGARFVKRKKEMEETVRRILR